MRTPCSYYIKLARMFYFQEAIGSAESLVFRKAKVSALRCRCAPTAGARVTPVPENRTSELFVPTLQLGNDRMRHHVRLVVRYLHVFCHVLNRERKHLVQRYVWIGKCPIFITKLAPLRGPRAVCF